MALPRHSIPTPHTARHDLPRLPIGVEPSVIQGDTADARHPRVLSAASRLLGVLPRGRRPLQVDALLAGAESATGLSDWGTQDFMPAFERLVEAFNDEARLTPLGRVVVERQLSSMLHVRLRLEALLQRYPEIREIRLRKPIFVLGLPRTGTTLLQRLLSQDSDTRSLRAWEAMFPVPLQGRRGHGDPRVAIARKRIDLYNWMCPDLSRVHEVIATEPEECTMLLQNSFMSPTFGGIAMIPGYLHWLNARVRSAAYHYYALQLKALHWQRPGHRWLLKSPAHLFSLNELMKAFPDACIVQTHREPSEVTPSFCNLVHIRRTLVSDAVDPQALGRNMLTMLDTMVESAARVRQSAPPQRFFDVSYRGLLADPIGTVARLYEHFDMPFTAQAEAAMHDWLRRNPQHRRGAHRYSLQQFGLDRGMVDAHLANYRTRFAAQL